jgi:drug/metabolite transporter (DMT)-like permease
MSIFYRTEPTRSNMRLAISMISYLILTPIDSIVYIQWINGLMNYKWLSGAIIYPFVGTLFFYIPLIWYRKKGLITEENTNLEQKYLFILAIFDSCGSILGSLTVPYINILIMVVLGRITLPLTMIFSYFLLNRRYHSNHYCGLALTLIGVFLMIIPQLLKEQKESNPLSILIYTLSVVPGVLSYIYKEKYLKGQAELNIWWMNCCISLWQFVIGLITIPILFLSNTYFTPETFIDYIKNGLDCQFGGINHYSSDNCRLSFLWLAIYQFISTLANVLMFMILRHGSSLMYLVLATLKAPITGFLGYILISYNLIYTTDAQKVQIFPTDYVSLVLIIAGSVIYNLKQEYTEKKNNLQEHLLDPFTDDDFSRVSYSSIE